MAAQIGSLYVDLTMNSGPFVSGMNAAGAATARAAASINQSLGLSQKTINAFNSSTGSQSFRPYAIIAASRGYDTAADRANLLRGSLLAATAVAGGFVAALGTNLISRYADTVINLDNALKTVATSSANLAALQQSLGRVADSSRSSLQSTVTLYARTARASQTLGLSQENLLRVTETVQKAFAVGGATTEEAQGAAIQLSQAIASNRFSGDEFRSVAENAPVLLTAIANSLGVNIGKLRLMGQAGQLTSEIVTKAILKASDTVDAAFGKTTVNIDRAITNVDNKILEFVGNIDKSYGLVGLVSKGVLAVGDNLDHIVGPLTQVGALLAAVFVAKNKIAVGGGLGALLGAGIGGSLGGIQGAIYGALAGGFSGVLGAKNGTTFISAIKTDAKAAQAEVIRLAQAESALAEKVDAAGKAYQSTLSTIKQQGVFSFAPGSAQNDAARAAVALAKTDAQLLANGNIGVANSIDAINARDAQRLVYEKALAAANAAGAANARQTLGEQGTLYRNLQEELASTSSQLGVATKASSAFSVGMRAVSRAGSSLVSLFGGPWGVAITAASLIFGQFAEDAQKRAQSIANAKSIIDEVLQQNPSAAPTGDVAGSLLASQLDAINGQITETKQGAQDAYASLRALFGLHSVGEGPLQETAIELTKLLNLPIQGELDKLSSLIDEYERGAVSATDFTTRLDALKAEANNSRFSSIADQVQGLTDTVVRAGPAVDALKQQIVDLQAVAKDPINVEITTSFAAIDKQPVNAPLSNALSDFVGAQNFESGLDKEISTLRLVGDARKEAEYTTEELNKAKEAKVVITDAVKARIEAFAKEKVALEDRDNALKKDTKADTEYARAVTELQQKTAGQALDASSLGDTTFGLEKAKAAQDLLNAAQKDGEKITPSLIADIDAQSDAYARQADATKTLTDNYNLYKDAFTGFFDDLKSNLQQGASFWTAFATAATNALNKIIDKTLSTATSNLFDVLFKAFTGGVGGSDLGISTPGISSAIGGDLIGGAFATGGLIVGRGTGTSDSNLALVSNGEYVVKASATRKYLPMLNAINGYADGGLIGAMPSGGLMSTPANQDADTVRGEGGGVTQVNVHFHGVTDMGSFQKSRSQITTALARAVGGARRFG